MNARVQNTMAMADKKILNSELENFKLFSDFTFDQEIGYIVCNLLDAKIRAVSVDNIIMSYEYDSTVKQNLIDIDQISYVYNKITDSNKKLAIISDKMWENEKNKYISNIKEGNKYYILEEPAEILEELVNDDIMVSSAVKLFGDIVEFD